MKIKNKLGAGITILLGAMILIIGILSLSLSMPVSTSEAHAEPKQTYNINSADDFVNYSRSYAAGDKNEEDVLNISINTGSAIVTDSFISLGTVSRPFAGTIVVPTAGVNTFHLANCPLFDYVTTDMKITGLGVINIQRVEASETPATGVLTSGSLFANHVVAGTGAANWSVNLSPYTTGEATAATSFDSVIGSIAANCTVTMTYTDTSTLSVSGSGNLGLICGSVGSNATLNVSTAGSGANRTIISTGGHAGGLVGVMSSGSTLKFNSANNTRISSITSSSGYAGGIVGYADDITVEYNAGVSDYSVSSSVSGSLGAGGLYGYFKNTKSSFGLTKYTLASGLNISGAGTCGGVFGYLDNTASAFTFDGNASGSEVLSFVIPSGSSRGGICGTLKTAALTDDITFTNVAVTLNSAHSDTQASGGLIGVIASSPAYVAVSAVSVTSLTNTLHGGLIGNVGEGGSFVDVSGSIAVTGKCDASLVAHMPQGVLRIQGVTDLSGFVKGDSSAGTIVQTRGRALIYALGDGKGTNGNWTLKRNVSNAIDDVYGWGQVLRTDGTILSESDLFTVNTTANTVTVKAAVTTINNVTQFALTALNCQLNTGAGVGALLFTSGSANRSATLLAGTLTLGADIDLTGTGLLGLTRDDGKNNAFSGTFNGGTHTITFATGKPYGLTGAGAALDAGSNQGNVYNHEYSGLFAKTNDATVSNLTLSGDFIIDQNKTDMKLGGVTAYATGSLALNGVSADFTLTYKTLDDYTYFFGGVIGQGNGTELDVTVTGGTIKPTVTDNTAAGVTARTCATYIGGAIGGIAIGSTVSPTQSVSFDGATTGLTYTKSTNTARESAFGGAIAHIANAVYEKDSRTVEFTNGSAIDITASGRTAGRCFGGILGFDWIAVDVAIDSLTIDADITAAGTVADFGGLVYLGTGGWSITGLTVDSADFTVPNNSSTFGFVVNKSSCEKRITVSSTTYDAYSALYLAIDNTASNYDIGALSFSGGVTFSNFDEIVADSRYQSNGITNNGNSVVSVTTSGNVISTTGAPYNTYLNKTAYGRTSSGRINAHTRYYYNLPYAIANRNSAGKYNFLVWSVKTYAHESLEDWFPCTSTFSGDLDMTGLSYYPVDLNSSVTFSTSTATTLKLDNLTMESNVKYAYYYTSGGVQSSDTRTTLSSGNQHYLMHTSVFRNVIATVNVTGANGLTIQGNVPKLSDSSCGFLISGTLGGSDTVHSNFIASLIKFDGSYITSSGAQLTTNAYAPLLINKVAKNTTVTIDGAEQSTANYSSYAASGYYAASSLIGDVGNVSARAIYLTFAGLVFDGRNAVNAIGNMNTTYGTTKSIFSRATILNSFLYFGESAGNYNFYLDDDWTNSTTAVHKVTYGKEITSSLEYVDEEKTYSVEGNETAFYVRADDYPDADPAHATDFSTGFLPYVYVPYNTADLTENKHELRVNISISTTIEGCGKYGDPFIIDDEDKLLSIAEIISTNYGSGVSIYLPDNIASKFDWTSTDYTKRLYSFGSPYSDGAGHTIVADTVRRYLTGAYYVITQNITLASTFPGLGSSSSADYAFRGIIIGRGNPTITNTSNKPLIHTSLGCVVQNITVDVDVNVNSSNVVSLTTPTAASTYEYSGGLQSYGAVIGQILGGDTIIDRVQVTFSDVSWSYTSVSNLNRLVPIGGYVGALVNGGLIFRNMTASNVGLTSTKNTNISDNGYLYVNPIIGRVIAGYAFHETTAYHSTESTATLKNGEKNYTICDLSLSEGKLNVAYSSSKYTVTVPDGQALFILGAIVNSGAASASYHASTEQPYADLKVSSTEYFWSAYREYTTVRAGSSYSTVGESGFDSSGDYTAACNDKYTTTRVKVPYVIRAYSNATGGVYLARGISSLTNTIVKFTGDCDVSQGFRGIGSIYNNNTLVQLGISQCSGQIGSSTSSYELTFHMRYLEYNHTSLYTSSVSNKYIAYAASAAPNTCAGFGLFNRLVMNGASSSNSVQYLKLSGSIYYDVLRLDTGAQVAYNFANYRNNSYYDRTENGYITSGNTEDAVQRRTLLSVGGIAGVATAKYYIKNVTFNDLNVEGAKAAGGLIGFVYQANNDESNIIYETGVTNSGYVNVVAGLQAGGLVGRVYHSPLIVTGASGGTNIIVKEIASKNQNPNEIGMYYFANVVTGVGGIVGSFWGRDDKGTGSSTGIVPITGASIAVRKLFIHNINVVKGASTATVRVRNDGENKYNYAGGYVGSAHNAWVQILNSKLEGVNVEANIAGGFVARVTQKYYLYIQNCSIEGVLDGSTKTVAISGKRFAGGAAGWTIGRDTLYFQLLNFISKDYIIRSTTTTMTVAGAGGVLGYAQGNNKTTSDTSNYICEFNNITVLNCDIVTNYTNKVDNYLKYKCGTGGLIGVIDTITVSDKNDPDESTSRTEANKYKFSGYNILIKDTKLSHLNGGSSSDSTSATNRRIGNLVGNNAVQSPLWFVGVAIQNVTTEDGETYCGKHVGYYSNDNNNYGSGYYASGDASTTGGYVVFANYQESASNTSFTTSVNDTDTSDDDYVYVDSGTASYPYVTVNPVYTIGGVALTGDGVADTVAHLAIQQIITDGQTSTAKYSYSAAASYSGEVATSNLSLFSSYSGKLAMFTSEVSGYIGTDFPVLILDTIDRSLSTKMINSYLRLLTNTTYDFAADNSVYSVFVYKMTYDEEGVFTPSTTGTSLKRNGGDFYMTNNVFDSGKLQFSLIDLRFYNPATLNAATPEIAYRVFVPVFVKKVLSYSFDIAVQSGTTYHPDTYTGSYGELLFENVGTPVTFYYSYTYQRSAADWQIAINNGEKVHRYYDKNLMFYKANTNDILRDLPANTVLMLIDPNNGGRAYYSTVGTALSSNTLSLSAFRSEFSRSGDVITLGGDYFTPMMLEDFMDITVTTSGDTPKTLIACSENEATLCVSGNYYRLATEEETATHTAIVAINDNIANPSALAADRMFRETYYLSVFTESTAVTNELFHYFLVTSPTSFSDPNYPSKIADTGDHTMVHLIMGNIFHHDNLTVTSSSSPLDVEIMTSGNNVLVIEMTTQVGLSDDLNNDIKQNLQDLIATTEVYQSFLVYLNRKEQDEISKAILGNPTGAGTYDIDYLSAVGPGAAAEVSDQAYATIRVTQNYAEFVTQDISGNIASGSKFTISARVTLTYHSSAITTQFPGRRSSDPTDNSGVTVAGSSHIAFSEESTTYSKNILSSDDSSDNNYYSEADPEIAILDLNPVGDKVGDSTLLGINALNNDNLTRASFELLAVMEITAVADQITDYTDAVMTVTLQRRQSDGTYGEFLDVSDYITSFTLDGVTPNPITDNDTSFSAVLSRSSLRTGEADITFPLLQFEVLTGTELERAGLYYSNYRIVVNIALRDSLGTEYAVSRVSNYVIYTNAKLLPDYIDTNTP